MCLETVYREIDSGVGSVPGQCQCQLGGGRIELRFLLFDPSSRILFVCSPFESSFSRCGRIRIVNPTGTGTDTTLVATASLQLAWSAESSVLPLRPYAQLSRQVAQSIALRGPFRREDPLAVLLRHSAAGSFQRPEFRSGWSQPSNSTGTPLLLSWVCHNGAQLHCSMPPRPRVPVRTKGPARDHGYGRTCSSWPASSRRTGDPPSADTDRFAGSKSLTSLLRPEKGQDKARTRKTIII
jgi:hypothetical protein